LIFSVDKLMVCKYLMVDFFRSAAAGAAAEVIESR
jgi:hypothetical protein